MVHHLSARAVAAVIATALLATATVSGLADRRGRLDAETLARSRGSSDSSNLVVVNCNTQTGNAPCTVAGAACVTCDGNNYTNTGGAPGTGYGNGGGGNLLTCGFKNFGTCNGAGTTCVPTLGQKNLCFIPPQPPFVQRP